MEQKVKKRTWVKDVAIIFLAVMLVLTFFSNTILNRSLPEAGTALVQPGEIDAKVRISGTVQARENYDVTISQSRKVASVAVKLGQEVSTGDVLFTLEPGDSDEVDSAKDALHALELQYQKALVQADNNDYARENRNIELAQQELERARTKYNTHALTNDQLTALEKNIEDTEAALKSAQREVDVAQTGVNNSSEGDGYVSGGATSSMHNALNEAKAALAAAENERKAAHLAYDTDYNTLKDQAELEIRRDYGETEFGTLDEAAKNALYNTNRAYYMEKLAAGKLDGDPLLIAYTAITAAEAAYTAAQKAVTDAQNTINDANSNISYGGGDVYYKGKSHSYWLKELEKATEKRDVAQTALEKYKAQKTNYEETFAALNAAEEKLRGLQDALEDAKKNDRLEAIDLQELQRQIAEAREDVEKLSGGDTSTEVKAKVNGIVQSLAVSAGHTAQADEILATIEVPDLGFTMSATVTNEQARLLHVGDTATVSNFYWGAATTAEITAIRPDQKDPRSSKNVLFEISGDTAAGTTLSFAIGERSASYDYVVPNSAVRSDTNGKFILIITAKNSPLGNRYYATRVDVEVLAADDHNSAVSGALEGMSTVITSTSNNAPIKNGDQVRLPDEV